MLGDRAFGALLIILAVPNILPVPGLSTATGVLIFLLGAQLAAGRGAPWLPRRLAGVTVGRDAFLRVLARVRPWIVRVETHLLRPRLAGLAHGAGERLAGAVIMVMAAVMALPIVFGNQPPAFAVALMALGLIERDGAFVLAGFVTAVVALAVMAAVLLGLFEGAAFVFRQATG